MDSKVLAGIVSKVAPLLGSVLGGPLSGFAITLLSNAFNAKPEVTSVLAAINTTAKAQDKLREVETKHQEALLAIQAQDLASARNMVGVTVIRIFLITAMCILFVLECLAAYYFQNDSKFFSLVSAAMVMTGYEARSLFRFYFGMSDQI